MHLIASSRDTKTRVKLHTTQLIHPDLNSYKQSIIAVIGTNRIAPSSQGFQCISREGTHSFVFQDFDAVVWEQTNQQYLHAITQFVVLSINQYNLSVDADEVADGTEARTELQSALDTAKDLITKTRRSAAVFLDDVSVLKQLCDVGKDLEARVQALSQGQAQGRHTLRVTCDSEPPRIILDLDDHRVSISLPDMDPADILIYDANIIAAALQVLSGSDAGHQLLTDLKEKLTVYSGTRLGAMMASTFEDTTAILHQVKSLHTAITKLTLFADTARNRPGFKFMDDHIHPTPAQIVRVKAMTIVHYVLTFLHDRVWDRADKSEIWSLQGPDMTAKQLLADATLNDETKGLAIYAISRKYSDLVDVQDADMSVVRELIERMSSKFGEHELPQESVEDVVRSAMILYYRVKAFSPFARLSVSRQGAKTDVGRHKLLHHYHVKKGDQSQRLVFVETPGVCTGTGLPGTEPTFTIKEDIFFTRLASASASASSST